MFLFATHTAYVHLCRTRHLVVSMMPDSLVKAHAGEALSCCANRQECHKGDAQRQINIVQQVREAAQSADLYEGSSGVKGDR